MAVALQDGGRKLAELVPGVGGASVVGRHVVSIEELAVYQFPIYLFASKHRRVCLIVLGDVEVACYHGRLLPHYLLYLSHDELCTLSTSSHTNVVEVCVDCHEDFTSGFFA